MAPTHLALAGVLEELRGSPILAGAQSGYYEDSGAFTGQVSLTMIKEAGAQFCLVGHSEQRQFFGESDETVRRRLVAAGRVGLRVVMCVGETLAEREAGQTQSVLERQISRALEGIEAPGPQSFVLAYEPVWAIGTGRTATPEMAQEAHAFCRLMLARRWGSEVAARLPIQYGGSVKPESAKSLLERADIDGLLVGGASLELKSFISIATA